LFGYEGVPKSFRTGRPERELQMVQLSATRCSFIAILSVSLVSFAAITLCVASERVFIVASVYFVIDSFQKLLDTPSYDNVVSTAEVANISSEIGYIVYELSETWSGLFYSSYLALLLRRIVNAGPVTRKGNSIHCLHTKFLTAPDLPLIKDSLKRCDNGWSITPILRWALATGLRSVRYTRDVMEVQFTLIFL
jgi:hypothetical protein